MKQLKVVTGVLKNDETLPEKNNFFSVMQENVRSESHYSTCFQRSCTDCEI
jgi:hypothetical protein